uniref:Chromatin remodeling complex ATPase n=1 Tax=CrAss-like virus sp. ctjK323 TaxID=2825839 RepID=A0A8S5Q111_9CAUD|nr:MAG TPA: Chromatin remodeling complex ATPase [CrAss-like virus sp. ctjK323]
MTREEVYSECLTKLEKSDFLLLELATGMGKSKQAIDIINYLVETKYQGKHTSMLLLVAKTVHKQTWKDEFKKWGGINVDDLTIECYESLKKHEHESFDFVVMDEAHHLNSDKRLDLFSTLTYGHVIGLSATIPKKLKQYFQYEYAAEVVTCSIVDAIEDEVLPEPQIILYPLQLDNVRPTESIEVNPKAKGKTYYGNYNELWKYRKMKVHAIISCTPRQRVNEYNSQILYEKNRYMRTRQDFLKNKWLFDCGERIKYLANLKNNIVLSILQRLEKERTITFCKTIEQADILGKYSIHSKNKDSDTIYNNFNAKKINHIVSVNVLNEGANLVDCKYAVFANYSSSEICSAQRVGRSLRHKSPVIILPYYEATREEEIVNTMIESFKEESIHTIHSLKELDKFIQ